MNRYFWILGAFIALAALLAVGLGLNPREVPSPLVGKPAPAFNLAVLGKEGFTPTRIDARAEATMEPGMDPGPTVTGMHLVVSAVVPGIDSATFDRIANAAKAGCVISRALGVPVTLDATLEG